MSQKVKDKFTSKMNGELTVQSFIKKTFDILEVSLSQFIIEKKEQKYSDFVCWSEDGTSILIKNPTEFAQKVLPIYFKHNNLTSFVRQVLHLCSSLITSSTCIIFIKRRVRLDNKCILMNFFREEEGIVVCLVL
jgi:Heat shock transcription factor